MVSTSRVLGKSGEHFKVWLVSAFHIFLHPQWADTGTIVHFESCRLLLPRSNASYISRASYSSPFISLFIGRLYRKRKIPYIVVFPRFEGVKFFKVQVLNCDPVPHKGELSA